MKGGEQPSSPPMYSVAESGSERPGTEIRPFQERHHLNGCSATETCWKAYGRSLASAANGLIAQSGTMCWSPAVRAPGDGERRFLHPTNWSDRPIEATGSFGKSVVQRSSPGGTERRQQSKVVNGILNGNRRYGVVGSVQIRSQGKSSALKGLLQNQHLLISERKFAAEKLLRHLGDLHYRDCSGG